MVKCRQIFELTVNVSYQGGDLMRRLLAASLLAITGTLALTGCQHHQQAPMTPPTKVAIVTRAPAPKEVASIPHGHYSCFRVDAGWYNNTWVPAHKVCKYRHASAKHKMWVSGYWQCDAFNSNNCTNWTWVSGHWSAVKTVY
jgi:hypothetical protein